MSRSAMQYAARLKDAREYQRRKRAAFVGPPRPVGKLQVYENATPEFWERVDVALAVGQISLLEWSRHCDGIKQQKLWRLRNEKKRPPDANIRALCELTGATREWLDDPAPVDLAARSYHLDDIGKAAVEYYGHEPRALMIVQDFIQAMSAAEQKAASV